MIRAFFLALLFSVTFLGCGKSFDAHTRGVYLLLSPTKERLAHKEQLKELLVFLVNDMSPGDTLYVDMPNNEVLKTSFSKEPAVAYRQKYELKKSLLAKLEALKPVVSCQVEDLFSRAKAFLSDEALAKKAILLCSTTKTLRHVPKSLEETTVSILTMIEKPKQSLQSIKQRIQEAEGRFILASRMEELNKVLSY